MLFLALEYNLKIKFLRLWIKSIVSILERTMILNIIFLDIDGVLNSMAYFKSLGPKSQRGHKHDEISDFHLQKLSEIYHSVDDCKIVLSSTWRQLSYNMENNVCYGMYMYLVEELKRYDMEIYDQTPYIYNDRPFEIYTWIRNNVIDINNLHYCILDDDYHISKYKKYNLHDHLVETRYFCNEIYDGGLQDYHVELAKRILTDDGRNCELVF